MYISGQLQKKSAESLRICFLIACIAFAAAVGLHREPALERARFDVIAIRARAERLLPWLRVYPERLEGRFARALRGVVSPVVSMQMPILRSVTLVAARRDQLEVRVQPLGRDARLRSLAGVVFSAV